MAKRLDREEVRALFRPKDHDKKAKRADGAVSADGLGPLAGCRVLVVLPSPCFPCLAREST